MRADVAIPPGSKKMIIEFLVDDVARVYVNGVEVTDGFQSAQAASCPAYARVVNIKVPDGILSPDGVNKVAIWANDSGGYVNYFDMQVTASVAN